MNKKYVQKRNSILGSDGDDSQDLLHNIHKKLDNSPALNGGFDRLLYKIDGIEKSKNQIVEKVDKIHEAIYHPDDGLFSRIASTKTANIESVSKIEKQVFELTAWRQQNDSSAEECEKETDEIQVKMQKIEHSIEKIENFQNILFTASKWLGAAVGGALISFIAEMLYKVAKHP